MKCLSKFFPFLNGFLKRSDSFDSALDQAEPLSRYLLENHKRYFDEQKSIVKPPAFSPSKKTNDLSVYRTKQLPEESIWQLGDEYVTKKMKDNPAILARADVLVAEASKHPVRLNPDGKPHPRHLNIEDWPADESKRKMITVELASIASLRCKK